MVNEMLTQMERFEGVFIASTNLMDGIDPATLRRFDLKLKFDYLKPDQAGELFLRWCAQMKAGKGADKAMSAVKILKVLTPGDFAALARRHRFEPLKNAEVVAHALHMECELKGGSSKRGIGFL